MGRGFRSPWLGPCPAEVAARKRGQPAVWAGPRKPPHAAAVAATGPGTGPPSGQQPQRPLQAHSPPGTDDKRSY